MANETEVHVGLDSWTGSGYPLFEQMERENPSIAPVDLGSMGYDGEESLYVSDPVRQAAFEEFGLALDFYKAYNTSHHNPKKYFDSVSDINISEVAWCNTTEFTNPERISLYLQYSGDYAGAVQVDETYVAKCEDGHWWRAPACRHDWSACIPLVTGGAGWRLQALMSWAAAYGIPAAVGVSNSWGNYVKHVTQVRSLFYWWLPDSTFIDMNPSEVVFPRHSARAWEQGDKRTGAKGSYVSKIVSNNLQAKSRLVHGFVKNINFELPEVQRMLADYETLGAKEAACNWVKENPAIWRRAGCPLTPIAAPASAWWTATARFWGTARGRRSVGSAQRAAPRRRSSTTWGRRTGACSAHQASSRPTPTQRPASRVRRVPAAMPRAARGASIVRRASTKVRWPKQAA
ncbi:unnamed protein product [Effrenium voratum]|uniref:Uncharacterized protein n=1 Tax=Effrenium voratum TaxID=2562239 RepID=A0AA36J4A3_9DINO|nr:unnamed protein product [Effrenium voratum]